MKSKQQLSMSTSIKNELELHWDKKLRKKFALAPVDLVRLKLVNKDNYQKENRWFGVSASGGMMEIRNRFIADPGIKLLKEIHAQVAGGGLDRDLLWIPEWVGGWSQSRFLTIRDISPVGCNNVAHWTQRYPNHVTVRCEELEESWEPSTPEIQNTVLIYASQFIQICKPEKMQRIMRLWGACLRVPEHLPKHTRRICLIHPLPEDNIGEVTWMGRSFKGVQWGDTTPYSTQELREPAEEGLQGKVGIAVVAKYKYFHQTYSLLEITSCEV